MDSRRLVEVWLLTALTLLAAQHTEALTLGVDEPTGEASIALPILMPRGTAGTGPDLVLRYRSGSARGQASWVGLGWTLAGLSRIERDTKHGVPYDYASPMPPSECGAPSAPCYPYRARFVLDGRDLVCATSPCDGTYRTQQDDGHLIRQLPDSSWEIQNREGVVLTYGADPAARIENAANREVFAWLLESVRDVHGNWIEYRYDRATSPGVAYPESIRYAQAGESEANRSVEFVIAPRSDGSISYRAGFREQIDHSLVRIDVRGAQGALVAHYELAYAQSPDSRRSLLASIQRFGSDGISSLPPHRFVYSESARAFTADASDYCGHGWACGINSYAITGWPSRGFVDLDRDGLTDVFIADSMGSAPSQIFRGLGDMLVAGGNWTTTPVALLDGVSTSNSFEADLSLWRLLADVDGDGYPDSLSSDGSYHRGTPTALNDVDPRQLVMPTPPFFPQPPDLSPSWLRFQKRYSNQDLLVHALLSDMNGDGLPDLVASTSHPDDPFWAYAGSQEPGAWRVHLNRGADAQGDVHFETTATLWPDPYEQAFNDSYDNGFATLARVLTLDVNADGLPDRLSMQTFNQGLGRSVWVGYNHGAGFADPEMVASWTYPDDPQVSWASAGADLRGTSIGCVYSDVLDLNGDGFPDLVQSLDTTEVQQFVDPLQPAWLVRFGTGDGFRDEAETWSTSIELSSLPDPAALPSYDCVSTQGPNPGEVVSGLVDLNGDGLLDHHSHSDNAIYLAQGPVPDLLVEASNPYGGSALFSYGSSAQMRDELGEPANPGLGRALPIVTQITQRDGRPQTPEVVDSYHYAAGVYDSAEQEFRGFGRVTRTEHTLLAGGDLDVVTTYATDRSCSGLVTERTRGQGAAVFDAQTQTYLRATGPPGVLEEEQWTRCLLSETVERSIEGMGGPGRIRGSVLDYGPDPAATHYNLQALHEYGELDSTESNLSTADDRFTYYFYATPADGGSHIVSHVSEVIVTDAPASDPLGAFALATTRFHYDQAAGIAHGQVGIGQLERIEVLHRNPWAEPAVDEWFSSRTVYDRYGNAIIQQGPPTSDDPNGLVVGLEYDSTYQSFRTRELYGADLGSGALVTEWKYAGCAAGLSAPPGLGLPCAIVDPRGSADRFGYDALGRTARIERKSGLLELSSTAVPPQGGPAETRTERRLIQSEGGTLMFERWSDGLGRVFEERSPGKSGETIIVSRSFDERGRVAAQTLPHFAADPALSLEHRYDALGRPTETIAPDGTTRWTWAYSPWATSEDVFFGAQRQSRTELRRDGRGRLVEVVQYEDAASLSGRRIVSARYDALDQLARVDDPIANNPGLCADSACAGQLHSTLLFYDTLGRRVRIEAADSGVWSFAYDRAGRLKVRTDAAARTQRFEYDALGRRVWRRFGVQGNGSYDAQFSYGGEPGTTEFGRLIGVASPHALGVDYAYGYDSVGRMVYERQEIEQHVFENHAAYDELDRITSRTFPDGEVIHYRYDGLRHVGIEGITFVPDGVAGFDDAFDIVMDARYDAMGRTEWMQVGDTGAQLGLGPAVVLDRDYDPVTGRLTRIAATGRGSGSADLELFVAFDGAGRLTDESGHSRSVTLSPRSFDYDGLGRLVQAVGPWEQSHGNAGSVTWAYRYDPLGSLLEQTSSNPDPSTRYERSWRYEDPEKPRFMTSFAEHGAAPDTESFVADPAGVPVTVGIHTVLWNDQNRLHQFGAVRYRYDAFDQIVLDGVSQQLPIIYVGKDFEYDSALQKATKYFFVNGERVATRATFYNAYASWTQLWAHALPSLAPPLGGALLLLGLAGLVRTGLRPRRASWSTGPAVGLVIGALVVLPASEASAVVGLGDGPSWRGGHSEGILIYAVDHLGSTRIVLDAWGNVVESRDYTPFGQTISRRGPFDLKHRFTGQPHDDVSGLTAYGARMFQPRWARFLSPDEAVESFDIQGLHPYAYVRNRPTSLVDPDGRSSGPPFPIKLGVLDGVVGVAGSALSELGDHLGPEHPAGGLAKGAGGALLITGATLGAGLALGMALTIGATAPAWATVAILSATVLLAYSLYSTLGDLRSFRSVVVEIESRAVAATPPPPSVFDPPRAPSGAPVVSARFDGMRVTFVYADGTVRTELGGDPASSSSGGRAGELWGEPSGTSGPKTRAQSETEQATSDRAGPGYGNVAQQLAFRAWFKAGGSNWIGF